MYACGAKRGAWQAASVMHCNRRSHSRPGRRTAAVLSRSGQDFGEGSELVAARSLSDVLRLGTAALRSDGGFAVLRGIAILCLIFFLALAVFLAIRPGPASRVSGAGRGKWATQKQQKFARGFDATREAPKTNPLAGTPEGFFVGKGSQRAYVQFATPDPVLRSFAQSVMEGGADSNAKGKELFLKICAACHQRDGEGKEGVAPPLDGSEWALTPGGRRLVRIALNGLEGRVRVQDKEWNISMPPWRENLDDNQLALVLTYIRTQLGSNRAGAITAETVAAVRQETAATPESSDGLLRISD
jgi:mono/diheme cytochrome c family protein